MREIKFRVWDGKLSRMIYPSSNLFVLFNGENYSLNQDLSGFSDIIKDEWCIIQQYSGLKDCNGKEMYEGDVVKFYRVFERERKVKPLFSFIRYDEAKFGFDLIGFNGMFFDLSDENDIEVMGNMNENPELLDKKV